MQITPETSIPVPRASLLHPCGLFPPQEAPFFFLTEVFSLSLTHLSKCLFWDTRNLDPCQKGIKPITYWSQENASPGDGLFKCYLIWLLAQESFRRDLDKVQHIKSVRNVPQSTLAIFWKQSFFMFNSSTWRQAIFYEEWLTAIFKEQLISLPLVFSQ